MTRYYAFFDAEYTCYMDSDRNFDRNYSKTPWTHLQIMNFLVVKMVVMD